MLTRTNHIWVGLLYGRIVLQQIPLTVSPDTIFLCLHDLHSDLIQTLALEALPPVVGVISACLRSIIVTGDQFVCACIKLPPRILSFASRSSGLLTD